MFTIDQLDDARRKLIKNEDDDLAIDRIVVDQKDARRALLPVFGRRGVDRGDCIAGDDFSAVDQTSKL